MPRTAMTVSTSDTPAQVAEAVKHYAEVPEGAAAAAPATVQPTGEPPAVAVEPVQPVEPSVVPAAAPVDDPAEAPPTEPEAPAPPGEQPAALEAGAPAAATEPAPDQKLSKSDQRKAKIKSEIDDLTRQRYAAQRELAIEEGRLQERREAAQPAQPPAETAPTGPPPEPTQDQYDTYELYDTAWRTWMKDTVGTQVAAGVQTELQRHRAAAAEWQARQAYATALQGFTTSVDAARARHEDYDEVTTGAAELPVTEHMHNQMVRRPLGAEIMYELCNNPEECKRIAALPPSESITELALLEGEIARRLGPAAAPPSVAPAENPAAAQAPTVRGPASKAPPRTRASRPIQPLGPGAVAAPSTLGDIADEGSRSGDLAAYRKARIGR